MALDEINDVGENAFIGGFLDRKYCNVAVDRLNLWTHMRVSLPSSAYGSAKFVVSDEAYVLDLTKVIFTGAGTRHALKLIDATTATEAKILVVYGTTGGRIADASMTAGGLLVTLSANGTRYILARMTQSYSAPVWSNTASAITEAGSVTAADATNSYFELGRAIREANGTGGFRVQANSILQNVSGSQGVGRMGMATAPWVDGHWLI